MAADACDALYECMTKMRPAHRIGQARDVAQATVFAATNTFVTGSTVNVVGGSRIA
jgi:NAD(P)-dependent dehydrogenase (short-subunit alcohol dehydrogenase family)